MPFVNNVFYENHGEGDKVIVFLHGLGSSSENSWLHASYFHERGWRVVLIDLPSMGKSEKLVKNHKQLVRGVHEVVEHLKLKGFVLYGYSLGAVVASKYASAHPDLVKGLVVIGGYRGGTLPVKLSVVKMVLKYLLSEWPWNYSWNGLMWFRVKYLYHYSTPESVLIKKFLEIIKHPVWKVLYWSYLSGARFLNKNDVITVPSLVFAVKTDKAVPWVETLKFLEHFTNNELVLLNTGHMMFYENKEEILVKAEKFINALQ